MMNDLTQNGINQNDRKIVLERNSNEEINLNYKKIYDLSKLDLIEKITQEEKLNLLITIKKLLLCTNDYLDTSNTLDLIRYTILTFVIFILYHILYDPIYKIYFLTEEQTNALPEFTLYQRIKYYYAIELLEVVFRLAFNSRKKKKVRKLMLYYGRNELNKIMNNFVLDIDYNNFNLSIMRAPKNNFDYNEKIKHFYQNESNSFFQYVINYPNVRYYKWDKKILSEKEVEITDILVRCIKDSENWLVKKFSFTVIIVWIFYLISFRFFCLVKVYIFLFFRFCIFAFTKFMSIYMSKVLKNDFEKKEKELNKTFLLNDYFVLISGTVIHIFKMKENYVDKSLNMEEIYKKLSKEILSLNEKILS